MVLLKEKLKLTYGWPYFWVSPTFVYLGHDSAIKLGGLQKHIRRGDRIFVFPRRLFFGSRQCNKTWRPARTYLKGLPFPNFLSITDTRNSILLKNFSFLWTRERERSFLFSAFALEIFSFVIIIFQSSFSYCKMSQHKCTHCNKEFTDNRKLLRHVRNSHNKPENLLKCDLCDKDIKKFVRACWKRVFFVVCV